MSDFTKRKKALQDLISMNGDIETLSAELQLFDPRWDAEEALVCLTTDDVRLMLEQYVSGKRSDDDLHRWAEAIEMRDDLEYQPRKEVDIADVISFLANREINGSVTKPQADAWIRAL